MNNITDQIIRNYKPVLSVIVYDGGNNNYYLESHNINKDGKILEGKPLKQETLNEIVDTFFDERKDRSQVDGLIPENLLSFNVLPGGNYKMVWYRPAEVRMIYFDEKLHIKSGKAWIPALIYTAERNGLNVYAIASDSRPGEVTKLYQAPFHNVASDGDVCLGNAKVKKPSQKTYLTEMKYWEDLFWLSEFSHLNGSDNPTKTNLNTVWKKLLASKEKLKWNKLGELKPYKKLTLKDILK